MKDSKGSNPKNPPPAFEKPVMGIRKGLEPKGLLKKKAVSGGAEGAEDDDEELGKKPVKPVMGDTGEDLEEELQAVEDALQRDPENEELHMQRCQVLKKMGDKEILGAALEEAARFSVNPYFATKLGEIWEERFKYDKALPWRKKVVELKPDDAYAWKRLALAYVRIFDFKRARETYEKVFALQPDTDDQVGHTFFQEMQGVGLPKERRSEVQQFGLAIASRALELRPHSVPLLEGSARLARITREMDTAIELYEELLSLETREHSSYRQWKSELLRIYAREGYSDKWKELSRSLIEDYKVYLEKSTGDSNAWLQLALLQIHAGFFQEAIGSLKKSISADDKNVQALFELGRILVRLDRSEEAIEYYMNVVPSDAELTSRMKYHRALELCLADLYYRLGKYDDAMSIYLRDENANARYIGIILEAMGRDQEALGYYSKALELSQVDGRNFLALSEYYVRRNMWPEAEDAAEKGLKCPHITKEAHESLYVALATTKMKTNRIDEAMKIMEEAIEASPDLMNMDLRRVKLLFLLGKTKDARAAGDDLIRRVEKQLRCAPSASDLWSLLGDCRSLLGQIDKAREAYTQAMKYNAMDSEAVRGMGVLAEKATDYQKAIEYFSKFVLLEPLSLSTPPLREKVRQLKEKK
ncbi:MAG: tetratricopeptide repeat protein [Vulcanimicrobiota bacterium]